MSTQICYWKRIHTTEEHIPYFPVFRDITIHCTEIFLFIYKLKTIIKSTFTCHAGTLRTMEMDNGKRRQETCRTVSKKKNPVKFVSYVELLC